MALGDIYEATAGDSTDLYYVDTEIYGTPEYGAIYVLDADRPAVVDTGMGTHYEAIVDGLEALDIDPGDLEVVVTTHVHLDHAGGAGYLLEACPNASVYVHRIGVRHLVNPERLWEGTKAAVKDEIQYYAEPRPIPEERVVELSDGDEIDLGDRILDVHHVPGHAPHQIALYDPANDGVFTADAAGSYSPGLDGPYPETAPPNFDLEQCLADVETLQALDPGALYYAHFGDTEPDGFLEEYAERLEGLVDDVEAARDRFGDDERVVEHLLDRTGTDLRPDSVDVWGERKAHSKMAMNVRGILTYLDECEV